jgi:hypothetical protein
MFGRRERFDEVLRALRLVGAPRRHPELVAELLAESNLRFADVSARVRFSPGRYTRNAVFRCDEYEVLLLAWDRGASSAVHDHAGSQCWFMPVAGKFDLKDYAVRTGGHEPGPAELELIRTRRAVAPGAVGHKDEGDDVHWVGLSEGSAYGVTLHVYARPIDQCLVFDVPRGLAFARRLGDDALAGPRFAHGPLAMRARRMFDGLPRPASWVRNRLRPTSH